jgi:hypothetical protein
MKNSNDTIGNRTCTFRLVAQCLIQLRYRVPSLPLFIVSSDNVDESNTKQRSVNNSLWYKLEKN